MLTEKEYAVSLGRAHRLWKTKSLIWKEGEVSPGQIKSSGSEVIQGENLLAEIRTMGSRRGFLARV